MKIFIKLQDNNYNINNIICWSLSENQITGKKTIVLDLVGESSPIYLNYNTESLINIDLNKLLNLTIV